MLLALGMKNNCFVNVKVYFKNIRVSVRVRVHVQPYPPFPKLHEYTIAARWQTTQVVWGPDGGLANLGMAVQLVVVG